MFLLRVSACGMALAITGIAATAADKGSASAADSIKILFLGNSLTLHGPAPEIGWSNHWGMAASAAEKDYVHIVTRGIEWETGRKSDVRVKNLADFERNYRTWDIADGLKDFVAFDPDYLVIALGENAPNLETADDRLAYRKAFDNLLGAFMKGRLTRPNVVVRGVFWPNEAKDYEMAHAASDFAVPFAKADCANSLPGMSAAGLFTHGGVAGHPGDKGMAEIAKRILDAFFPSESGYSAWMNGQPVKVRPIRISAMPFNQWAPGYQRPIDQTEIAGMVSVEVDGPAAFRVMPARLFKKAVVRPLSKGVKPETKDREVAFTIPGPGYYVLELDGYHCPLEIFADPTRDFAAEKAAANIVFGPGRHEPVIVKLKSRDRVYIDKDAFVLGSFQADGVEDVKISGYGIICGSRNRRDTDNCYREGQASPIRIIDSKRITVDGPVVIDSSCWCVEAFNSSDLEFAHIKVTGAWRYNTDGIDICNSQRVKIRDSFVHSFDDTIVLKGIFEKKHRDDPVADIKVERCVCWCGWGRTLEVGYETWAPYFRNIVFDDCDLIHNNGAALSVHLGGPAPIEDITFRNIRVECDASELQSQMQSSRDQQYTGKAPNQFCLISMTNDKMFSPGGLYSALGYDSKDEPYGTFKRVTIENVDVTVDEGAPTPTIHIHSEPRTTFGEIKASGVRINGKGIDVFKPNL